jgi:outer membrane immunogenic protein
MKKLLVASIAAAAFCGASALAADLPVKAPVYKAAPAPAPIFSWTGFYVGGNVGGAWGQSDITLSNHTGSPFFDDFDPVQEAIGFATGSPRFNQSSFIGGVQVGYNAQVSPNFVIGLETDFSWQDLNTTQSTHIVDGCCARDFLTTSSTNNLFTLRARIGYASDRMLVYATGGWASAKRNFSQSIIFNFPIGSQFFGSKSGWDDGWTVGAGLEYALINNWTMRVEYLNVDLGNFSFDNPSGIQHSSNLKENIVRAAINYKFGDMGKAPVVAKY